MEAEIYYRFCVKEKASPDRPEVSRRIFITHCPMTEAEALARFEVIERLDHTAMTLVDSTSLRKAA